MNRTLSIAVLAGGVILAVYGVESSQSVSSGVSRFFTGAPTHETTALLVGAAVAIVIGLGGLTGGSKNS